jgi:hypothetical protein
MTELDDAVAKAENDLAGLIADMETTRDLVLLAAKEWLWSALPVAIDDVIVKRFHEHTVALGSAGTKKLKSDLDAAFTKLDAEVETHLGGDELWSHRQDSGPRGSRKWHSYSTGYGGKTRLPTEFQNTVDAIVMVYQRVLEEHGYRDRSRTFLSLGTDLPSGLTNPINLYGDQDELLQSAHHHLSVAIEARGQSKARGLWDKS